MLRIVMHSSLHVKKTSMQMLEDVDLSKHSAKFSENHVKLPNY